MERRSFQHKDLTFSWLDAGGKGSVLIALHAHWMEAVTFCRLATDLAPGWRVVALDQRGHGDSSHAATYTRQDYLGDLEAFYAELQVSAPTVLLGNSLGGINALQFAAGIRISSARSSLKTLPSNPGPISDLCAPGPEIF